MTDVSHRNGHGWRNAVIGCFGALVMLFASWMLNEAANERRSIEAMINEDRIQMSENRSRIAVLESEVRGLKLTIYEMRRGQGKRD